MPATFRKMKILRSLKTQDFIQARNILLNLCYYEVIKHDIC